MHRRGCASLVASPRALRCRTLGGRYGWLCVMGSGSLPSVDRPPTGRGSRCSIRFARLELERIAPLHAGVRIAAFRSVAPARCGASADERRIVGGDEGDRVRHRRALPGRVVARGVGLLERRRALREAGARTDNAHFTPACSSPPSAALLPRVAARSSMTGASVGDAGDRVRTRKCSISPLGAQSPAMPCPLAAPAPSPATVARSSSSVRVPGRVHRRRRCSGSTLVGTDVLGRSSPLCSPAAPRKTMHSSRDDTR